MLSFVSRAHLLFSSLSSISECHFSNVSSFLYVARSSLPFFSAASEVISLGRPGRPAACPGLQGARLGSRTGVSRPCGPPGSSTRGDPAPPVSRCFFPPLSFRFRAPVVRVLASLTRCRRSSGCVRPPGDSTDVWLSANRRISQLLSLCLTSFPTLSCVCNVKCVLRSTTLFVHPPLQPLLRTKRSYC